MHIHIQFFYRPKFLSEHIIIELAKARMDFMAVRTDAFLTGGYSAANAISACSKVPIPKRALEKG